MMSHVALSSRLHACLFRGLIALLTLSASLHGGTYTQNFSTATLETASLGDGTTIGATAGTITTKVALWAQGNKALQLMAPLGGNSASWRMADLDPGKEIQAFDATFNAGTYIPGAGQVPGAGWSLNFGAIPVSGNGNGEGGFVMTGGIVIAWDIYNNGGADNPSIEVFCNGVSVGNFPSATLPDTPVPDSGSFTLTNPASGGTTGTIAWNANAATVQTAVRLVAGWTNATVTGNAGGPWTINRGEVGVIADPTSNTAGLVPANSAANVTVLTAGTASVSAQWQVTLRAYRARAVAVHWDYNGLDVSYGGATIFTDLPTPGFAPAAGNKFAFSARCEGGNTMDFFLDDVVLGTTQLSPVETGGPVISEFMADNANGLEDEDTDAPDWIEIYNGQNVAANLSGYRLTNVLGNNGLWTFPSVTVAAYGYKIVYASGKNRTVATGQLHTNFTLQKEGGYLALVKPDGVTKATEFTYGAQYEDVSYGEKGPARTLGYMQPATPGLKVPYTTAQAPGGPAEDVMWSRDGGIITGATPLTITAPLAAGSTVRYTTDNGEPNTASPTYNPASPPAAFTVSAAANLRARVYSPGMLPGSVSSRTFLLIDASLTNYNGSGQVFSSHLPVIVLDSFGVPVDNYTDGANRPYRYSYAVVIDKDATSGRASLTAPIVNFQGRGGTHVRGSSSAGFPQRQYAWETWDNSNNDKDVSILGMPAESDWIIYAPYDDKALMRNFLVYSRARLLGGNGFGMRAKFCEVFFNQEAGQPVSYSDYRGVYSLMEKIKINKDRVDVAKLNALTTDPVAVTGGYIVKHDRLASAGDTFFNTNGGVQIGSVDPDAWNSQQLTHLQTYFNNFETALNGGNFGDPALGYQAYIDRDTFIDNQWFVEVAKQIDGYRLSQYFWKDRSGKIKNGPIWDYNLALGNADYLNGFDPTGWYYTQLGGADYAWYPRLHQHTTGANPYELRHWDRYWELRRGLFATANLLGEIDLEAATLLNNDTTPITISMANQPPLQENAVRRHYRRWPVLGTYLWPNAPGYAQRIYFNSNGNATTGEVDWMKNWLSQRLAWIDDQNYVSTVIYRPPNFSSFGGNVNAGTSLSITAYTGTPPSGYSYATGTIYYTTDGSDPRGSNGSPAGTLYSGAITLNTSQTVKARLYNGGNWSPASMAAFVVNAVPASAANIVVSEIMYAPPVVTSTESAAGYTTNDFEYLELLNVSATNVDLSNVAFSEGVLFNFGTNNPTLLTVPPGGRVVVAGHVNAFLSRYGNNPAVKLAGAFTGSLANGGEQITLLSATGATIAQFTYGNDEPWPVDAHGGTGFSLVLNNPAPGIDATYYNNGANWRSSGMLNGTPGLANSTPFAGSPAGDTDGDGLSDFFEYGTGSNQGSPASRNMPVTSVAPFTVGAVTQTYLKFDFRRNLSADGVRYVVQYSTNLATWASDASAVTYVSTHNNGDGTATVTYRSTQPASAQPRMFLRLSVTP